MKSQKLNFSSFGAQFLSQNTVFCEILEIGTNCEESQGVQLEMPCFLAGRGVLCADTPLCRAEALLSVTADPAAGEWECVGEEAQREEESRLSEDAWEAGTFEKIASLLFLYL